MKNKKATLTKKDIEKYWDMEFEILDYLEQKTGYYPYAQSIEFSENLPETN